MFFFFLPFCSIHKLSSRLSKMKISAILCILFTLASANRRTLVLLDDWSLRDTHSLFFGSLREQGFALTFKLADDASLNLSKYGEYLYDNLLIFAPTVEEFGGTLNVAAVTDFIDGGNNVMMAGSSDVSELLREIAAEVGIELDEKGTSVIDHMSFDAQDKGLHTRLAVSSSNLVKSEMMVGQPSKASILYEGVGMIADASNPLVLDVLHASSTAYSYSPTEEITDYPHAVGKSTLLVSALQARNNARVVISGSIDMFSDEFLTAKIKGKPSGNADLVKSLAAWCFKEKGVLKLSNIRHHLAADRSKPLAYTVTDEVEYLVTIEEYANGKWKPFNGKDIQMEFVRIDPFVRTFLKRKGGDYSAVFKVPDVYGVYQFRVDYNRIGYTRLFESTQVSVKPWRHTQYERFIVSAYPYYAASFSMMVGVVLFSIVFLHYKEDDKKKKAE